MREGITGVLNDLRDSPAAASLIAMLTLGAALLDAWGNLSSLALLALLLSLSLTLLAIGRRGDVRPVGGATWVVAISVAALMDVRYANPNAIGLAWLPFALSIALAVTAAAGARLRGRRAALAVVLSGGLWTGLVAATWGSWGHSAIDVFSAVTGGAGQLLHGGNPYSPIFQYLQLVTPQRWGFVPGHFAYGPIVPFLAAPGWLLGDVRAMSVVAAVLIVAGLWWLARLGPQREGAHRVLLLALVAPLSIHMIEQAWVEIYVAAGVVWWVALRQRHSLGSTPPLAAAFLVSPLAFPLVLPAFLWSRRARHEVLVAAGLALALALPFIVMTGAGTFLYDVLGFQVAMRPRYDALTLTSYLWDVWGMGLPGWLPVTVMGGLIVCLSRERWRPRLEAQLALYSSLLLCASLLLAKWAYFNYYFLVATMLMTAVAADGIRLPAGDTAIPFASGRHRARTRPAGSTLAGQPANVDPQSAR